MELKTNGPLPEDYRFHALPDACTYLVFDQLDAKITGVSKLRAKSEEFNLGKAFHFVNIRFLPGVWQGGLEQVAYGMMDTPYAGDLPLIDINRALTKTNFVGQQLVLSELVEMLIVRKMVAPISVIERIFQSLDDISSVSDMAMAANLSTRQLQRN